jgi:ribonucleoside-diphosphate reductase alpha chain
VTHAGDGHGNGNGNGNGNGSYTGFPVELKVQSDAPPCSDCGSMMVPNGACYRCVNCGGTSGCS